MMLNNNFFKKIFGLALFSVKTVKKIFVLLLVFLVALIAIRIYDTERGPKLQAWHTWTPDEMSVAQVDNASFSDYLAREDDIYKNLKENVTDKIPESEKTELNRYYENSLVYPPKFHQDWNRSYLLMPEGKPQGAVVLLHGLTDTPYSLTEMAALYQSKGFVVVAPRLPGHGTVPAGLTSVGRNEWLAVTRMAVREATALAGEQVPLHIVGFSNGGALAMKYTLSSLNDKTLRTPQQVILLSPMIGITSFARFAGLAGLPSIFPAFAKSAWLSIIPEFNPFKYNSFPVKAARESFLLTQELQQSIRELTSEDLHKVPPILTFQSVMDSTVSTRAVVNSLYRYLGDNGSELVLFDINHAVSFPPLFRRSAYTAVNSLLPRGARNYNTIVITNLTPNSPEAVATVTRAGETRTLTTPIGLRYPNDMFSLSHVALPFSVTDSLYGSAPVDKTRYGINLGTISMRGESSVLIVGMDALMRATSNPFFTYMMDVVEGRIACSDSSDLLACLNQH